MAKIKLRVSATIEDTFKDFIVSRKAKGLAEKTVQSYWGQFYAVARHLDVKMDIALLQKADLEAMIISMRDAGLSSNSINSYTRTLKSFSSWCNEESITRLNIGLYKAEETVKETYSDAELALLLKKPDIRKATFAEYRDWVIINFLLNCGSRAATVRAIQIRDVDMDAGMVFYRHTKKQESASYSPVQCYESHSAGVYAPQRWRGHGLPLLHGNRHTADGERFAAIHSKV